MPLTAGTVIDAARDYHGALSKQNAPDRLAYPQLTRFMNQLMNRLLGRLPGFFAESDDVTIDSTLLASGLPLTDLSAAGVKGLTGDILFRYTNSSPEQKVPGRFIPWEQRHLYTPAPSYTLRDNVIYLLTGDGDLGVAYASFDEMTVSYTPNPVAITANADELAGFPDDALEPFATDLAAFLVRRLVGSPNWEIKRQDADYQDSIASRAREDWLTRITRGITQQMSYYVVDAGP